MKDTPKLYKHFLSMVLILIIVNFGNFTVSAEEQVYKDIVPTMTGKQTPAPFEITENTFSKGASGWRAFDDDVITGWYVENIPQPPNGHFLKVKLGSAKKIQKISLTSFFIHSNKTGASIKDWQLYGSNDDNNWDLLASDTNPPDINKHYYEFHNDNAYLYYRINLTSSYHSWSPTQVMGIAEMELLESVNPSLEVPVLSGTAADSVNNLSWEEVDGATGYNVKRSEKPGGPYETIASNIKATFYTDINVTNGTTYHYIVTAVNDVGESENSNEVILTPSKSTTPPDSPFNLRGTPSNNSVLLSWESVINATGYNVKRSIKPGGPYTTITSNIPGTTYTDTEVISGTTYYYVVTAVNEVAESEHSNEVVVTPQDTAPAGNRAVLIITMANNDIKEYDLSNSQLQDFLRWYEDQSDRNGNKAYRFEKGNSGAYSKRSEYVAFRHISSFEVMEYHK